MPSKTIPRIGGNFAPPLDDTRLESYRQLIESLPRNDEVRDALEKLYACVTQWWELPGSTRNGSPHRSGVATMVPLEKEHQEQLWDSIPWKRELDGYRQLFDAIDRDVCQRNSQAVDDWTRNVARVIVERYFPEPTLYQKITNVAKQIGELVGLLPEDQLGELRSQVERMEACDREIQQAISTKRCDLLPYPTLEPTPLRDAAYHLLWFASELEMDREPITSDLIAPPPVFDDSRPTLRTSTPASGEPRTMWDLPEQPRR